jgi:hypothetical protein
MFYAIEQYYWHMVNTYVRTCSNPIPAQ